MKLARSSPPVSDQDVRTTRTYITCRGWQIPSNISVYTSTGKNRKDLLLRQILPLCNRLHPCSKVSPDKQTKVGQRWCLLRKSDWERGPWAKSLNHSGQPEPGWDAGGRTEVRLQERGALRNLCAEKEGLSVSPPVSPHSYEVADTCWKSTRFFLLHLFVLPQPLCNHLMPSLALPPPQDPSAYTCYPALRAFVETHPPTPSLCEEGTEFLLLLPTMNRRKTEGKGEHETKCEHL